MTVRDVMTKSVVRIHPEESVAVAARTLTHYNIGILPVCGADGRICGLVTDRDLVTRCVASGRSPEGTSVGQIMTKQVVWIRPEAELGVATELMGTQQVRRLPVLENGRLCGMVSMGDIYRGGEDTQQAMAEISGEVSVRR